MPDSIAVFPPGWRALDEEGAVVSGAQITFSAADSETARTVYSDSGLSTSLGSLVYCDDGGYPVSASGSSTKVSVYTGTTAYKVTCRTSSGVLVWQIDNVKGALDTSSFLTDALPTIDIGVVSKAANYTLVAGDKGKLVNANPSGGAFTLTLTSAVTLGDGWWCYVRHDGGSSTNAVNWATTSSQTVKIPGGTATSGVIDDAGRTLLFICDGGGFTAIDVTPAISSKYRITPTSSANALTIALLTDDGATPSATAPIEFRTRNSSDASAEEQTLLVSAATTVTIPSGGTLGATSAVAFNLWVVLFNDGGTGRLGVINCCSATGVYPLMSSGIVSSTAIGTGSDSAETFYSGSAVTSKPYQVLGRLEFESGLSTAGAWNVAPTRTVQYRDGGKLPGDVLQERYAVFANNTTGTTTTPSDDTTPLATEGVQVMTLAFTPRQAASLLKVAASLGAVTTTSGATITAALHRDSDAAVMAGAAIMSGDALYAVPLPAYVGVANSTSASTWSVRIGPNPAAGGTVRFGQNSAGAVYGTTNHASLIITEIQT